jgi:hypothetical protein
MYDRIDAAVGVGACANSCAKPPSRFELRQACEWAAKERARSEHLRSLPQGEPHKRLGKPADPPPGPDGRHPPGTILTNYEAAVRLYGVPIGIDDPRHSRFAGSTSKPTGLGARPLPKPWRPYTHDELRAIYGIHPSFQEKGPAP